LETGVKIYGYRVDNLFNETYQTLERMGTGGRDAEKDMPEQGIVGEKNSKDKSKDDIEKILQDGLEGKVQRGVSTLEKNLTNLNSKHFELVI